MNILDKFNLSKSVFQNFQDLNIDSINEIDYNWSDIANIYNISTDAIKQRYHRDLRKYNNLKLTKQTLDKNGNIVTEVHSKLTDQSDLKAKFKKEEDNYDIVASTVDTRTGNHWFRLIKKNYITDQEYKNILLEEISNIPPVLIDENITTSDNWLILLSSDKHIGADVEDNALYKNDYDKDEIFRRVVKEPLNYLINYTTKYGAVDKLIYFDLGDAIDGMYGKTTRGLKGSSSHTLSQKYSEYECVEMFMNYHKILIDNIIKLKLTKDLHFICAGNSNHGGILEWSLYKRLEEYINIKYPNVKTFISNKFIDHIIIEDECFIFSHGKDGDDRKKPMPLVINDNLLNYLNDYIKNNKLYDYNINCVSGDLHTFANTLESKINYIKGLSTFGSNRYAQANYTLSNPGLTYCIFDKALKTKLVGNLFF